jgi:hypothetical protein
MNKPEPVVKQILYYDSAPFHTGLSIRQFLAKSHIPVLEYPSYDIMSHEN